MDKSVQTQVMLNNAGLVSIFQSVSYMELRFVCGSVFGISVSLAKCWNA